MFYVHSNNPHPLLIHCDIIIFFCFSIQFIVSQNREDGQLITIFFLFHHQNFNFQLFFLVIRSARLPGERHRERQSDREKNRSRETYIYHSSLHSFNFQYLLILLSMYNVFLCFRNYYFGLPFYYFNISFSKVAIFY